MSLDRISLEGLRVFGRHGVREHEQRDGQEFVIDAVLWLDTRGAAANDDLSLTVDYGAVADRLVRLPSGSPMGACRNRASRR
jgi:7,8-dihydroneopterin aldolase/epimerase/oxygenase